MLISEEFKSDFKKFKTQWPSGRAQSSKIKLFSSQIKTTTQINQNVF